MLDARRAWNSLDIELHFVMKFGSSENYRCILSVVGMENWI